MRLAAIHLWASPLGRQPLLLMASLGCLACTGSIGSPVGPAPSAPSSVPRETPSAADRPGGPPAEGPVLTQPPSAAAPRPDPGFTPLGRLTEQEYRNTVRDLLGGPGLATTTMTFLPGYDTSTEQFAIAAPQIDDLLTRAEQLAQQADLTKLAACDVSARTEATCARDFVERVGRRAFRRPLEGDEVTAYLGLYTDRRAAEDHAASLRAVLIRMLMSPNFLYHFEEGAPNPGDGSSPLLTPFELASRLSYLLWQSMPDDTLLTAAEVGQLTTRDQVLAQTRRMLADPRAREAFRSWAEQWLGLGQLANMQKDPQIYPGFEAAKGDLAEGLRRFLDEAIWQGPGTVTALLTAPYTFSNARLASLYAWSPPGAGLSTTVLAKLDTDPRQRMGLFTQPALLAILGKANKSAPILRGVFVRERLLCSPLPPPPPGASTIPSDTPEAKTTREFFANLTRPQTCSVCHSQINPLGFGFEHFDGIGAYRDQEKGTPVDDSGELTVSDAAGTFAGISELLPRLGGSHDVAVCLTRQWFRFAYRRFDVEGDAPFVAAAAKQMETGGSKIAVLPEALSQQDPFYRLHFTTKDLGK